MDEAEHQRRLARLEKLGVPEAFRDHIAGRERPRGHIVMHAAIILASIGLAVWLMVVWSRYLDRAAESAAQAGGVLLYNSDLGLESLGGLLTVLLAAGWLCAWISRRRGSQASRNGAAYDLIHEPAKYKTIVDQLWSWMVAAHGPVARDAEDFLDRMGGGLVRYLRFATLVTLAGTAVLAWLVPAHYSLATSTTFEDRQLVPWPQSWLRPFALATAVTSGCPVLPKDGSTLVYRVSFADGAEADLGSWRSLSGGPTAALAEIAAHLPNGIAKQRFFNALGTAPLNAECLHKFASKAGGDDMARLLSVLNVSETEKTALHDLP